MEYQIHYSHVDAKHRKQASSGTSAPTTPEQHYKVIYFEALDTIVGCIKNRFEQRRICNILPAGGHLGDKHIRGRL